MDTSGSGIFWLCYSQKQKVFHFEDQSGNLKKGWAVLRQMCLGDCESFVAFLEKKYVDGRVSGILPELDVVKIELDLFFALKSNKRKLAGRY